MKQNDDDGGYRCTKTTCRARKFITSDTIFDNIKISIATILFILYEWCVETPIFRAACEYDVSEKTVSLWYLKFREFASYFCIADDDTRIGGPGTIVEIDECLVVKRKYNRGRFLSNQQWIFGGVVRGEHSKCFIEFVENRTQETLLEMIQKNVLPGTTIYSDCWRAYIDMPLYLPEMNLHHCTVNHSKGFLNKENPEIHTQNIEAFWSVWKRCMRKRGTNYKSSIETYFIEHMYLK